jgi:TonB-linked SusC/RagA family outer membrane protein
MNFTHTKYIVFFFGILLYFPLLEAQQKAITGIVTGADDNLPIPGVTVAVSGTAQGTITDLDGIYSIEVPAVADSLEFRFIGMETRRVAINNRNTIDVIMRPEVYSVDEVVVTALGISRESKSLGYAVTAVNSDELTEGNNRSVLNALQGKVAGVNITSSSGAPGASTRILVRGVSSLTGSNQPLFVIDGVPVNNTQSGSSSINGGTDFGNKANDLNPEDIESVSILKGASGTALYGSRAANGVIIITTKEGTKNKKTQVSFNSSVTFEKPLRLVQYQNDYGQGVYGNHVLYENMSWGPKFDNRFRPWGHEVDSSYRVKAYRALPDNVKEFFETGISYNNSVSVNGGSDRTSYYFSYSNIHWDGIFPTDADSYKKHTIALRAAHEISKRLSLSTSFNYIKKINSFVPTGQGEQSVYNQIMQTPRDISLKELSDLDEKWNTIDNHYSLYTVNPYHILKNNGNENNEDRLFGSIDLDYTFFKDLSLKWRVGGDLSNENRKVWRSKVEPEGNNEFAGVFDPGTVSSGWLYQLQLNSDIILNYTKETTNWDFNFLAGHSLNQRNTRGFSASVQYLDLTGFFNLANSLERPSASEASVLRRMVGVFGSADVIFKDFWFLSLTARNEWSSTLAPGNNSYFFPGANTGLIFTELFPSIQDILTFGKIRVSWARVGNDAPPYQIYTVFQQGYHSDGYGYLTYPLTNSDEQVSVNSYDLGDLMSNPDLKPEITDEYEAGTDLRFFNNRFSIDFAYYYKTTTNLIWPSPLPFSSGYRYQMQNLGKITNHGFEILAGIVPVRKNNFRWEFSVNFTKNNNKLNYLNDQLEKAELNALRVDGGQQINWVAIPGMPVGVFEARAPLYTSDGKMVVNNQGLPVADEDLHIYGNSQYKYFGGISNRFTFKGVTFSFRFDFRKGGLMYSRTKDITLWAGTVPETLYNDREPFIIPNSVVETGTDANGDPIYEENTKPIDLVHLSEYWGNGGSLIDGSSLIDKSFVKLREVVLSYSVPERLLDKLPVSNLSFSIIGRNLLLWTPKDQTYIDPELTTFGNDFLADFGEYGAQPSTRSVSFNLKIIF